MTEKLWIITPQQIAQYAQATENLNPVYQYQDSAREAGFEKVIAPSNFCAQYQMFQDAANRVPPGGIHVRQTMSYYKVIEAGDYIYQRTEVRREKDEKGRDLIIYKTLFVNQDEDVVCEGEMINLLPASK